MDHLLGKQVLEVGTQELVDDEMGLDDILVLVGDDMELDVDELGLADG